MKSQQDIVIGWDNGNGTSIASAEVNNRLYNSFFPTVYSTGRRSYTYLSTENDAKSINPALNGNAEVFRVDVEGTTVWGGQTAYATRGQPINVSGFNRYFMDKYMKHMYYLMIQSLLNTNMPVASINNLYMTVGMPPKVFYEQPKEAEEIKQAYRSLLLPGGNRSSAGMVVDGKDVVFKVRDVTFTAEGTGGYYDAILNDNLTSKDGIPNYMDDGVLIIDIGRYTFDIFILMDNQLGEEVVGTSPHHGLNRLFEIIVDNVGGTNVTVSEVERHNYNGSSRLGVLRDSNYGDIQAESLWQYISELETPISYYRERSDNYKHVLIIGGISEFFDDEKMLSRAFSINGHPVTSLGVRANADGYRKFAKVVKLGGS